MLLGILITVIITVIVLIGLMWYSMHKLCKEAEDHDQIDGCGHPVRYREYYRAGCYKCWECGKVIVE